MKEADQSQNLGTRADIIIVLLMRLLAQQSPELRTLQDQILFLQSFGLKPREIANILGKTDNHIRKELSIIRKPKSTNK